VTRTLGNAVCMMLLLWTSASRAQDVDVRFTGPASCPDSGAVTARVERLLADSPGRRAAQVSAVARVRRQRGGYALTLRIEADGSTARRTLREANCEVLAEAAAWLIAVAANPEVQTTGPAPEPVPVAPPAQAEPPAPEPTPAAQPAAAPAPKPPAPASSPEPSQPRRPRERPGSAVGLMTGLWSDGLGGVHPSLGVHGGLAIGPFLAELRFLHAFARSESLPGTGGDARYASQAFTLAGCALFGSRVKAGPCLELSAVRSAGSSDAVLNSPGGGVFWANAGAGALVTGRLWRRLELGAALALALPLSARPEFAVNGASAATQSSYLTTHGELRLSYRVR
jgi:hypothetical protein